MVTLGLVVGAVASDRDTTYNVYGVSAKTDKNQDSTVGLGFMYDSEVFKAKVETTSDFTKLGLVYKYSPLTDLYFKFGGNYINQKMYAPDSSNTRVNQYSGALAVGYMLKNDIYAEIGGAVTKLDGKVFGDYEITNETTSIVYGELVKRWFADSIVIDTTTNFGKVFHDYSDDETTYGVGLDIYPTVYSKLGGGYYYENNNKAYNLNFTYKAFFVEYSKNISADTYQANLGVKFTCKDVWTFSGCSAPTNIVKDISELHRFEDISFSTNMELQSNEGVVMTQEAKDRIEAERVRAEAEAEAERVRAEEEAIANAISPVLTFGDQTFTTTAGVALVLADVTAIDNLDGVIPVVISGDVVDFNVEGVYHVIYTATDSNGNISTITHTYNVGQALDVVAPVLNNTTQTFTTTVGSALVLATVTANDVVDGSVAVVIGGDVVNFNVIGTYNVTYTATDSAGNSTSITHTYVVNAVVVVTDTTPNGFTFTDLNGQNRSTLLSSNTITVSGINSASAISVSGGEYSVNGGAWVSSNGSVNNGDSVAVRVTSSGSYSTTVNVTLSVGGVSDVFSVTTESAPAPAVDTTPNGFTFTDLNGQNRSTLLSSNTITVSGINSASAISVSGGEYSVNGGAWVSSNGSVNNGDSVAVRVTSSGSYSTTVNVTLSVGGVSDVFSVTTESAPVISTPTISLANQAVDDNGGFASTDLPAPSVTGVNGGAVYSITSGATGLSINSSTGVMTYNGDVIGNQIYNITIKVTNTDGGNSSTTFTLTVVDNG